MPILHFVLLVVALATHGREDKHEHKLPFKAHAANQFAYRYPAKRIGKPTAPRGGVPGAMANMSVGARNYTEADIARLWETKVRVTDEYLTQYAQPGLVYQRLLAADPNLRLGELHRPLLHRLFNKAAMSFEELLHGDHDYPRVPCVLDFIAWTRKHGLTRPESMLTTFPDDFEMPYIAPRHQTSYMFDGRRGEGDLHLLDAQQLKGEPFDFALVSQTLEHLYDPISCLRNLWSKVGRPSNEPHPPACRPAHHPRTHQPRTAHPRATYPRAAYPRTGSHP